MSKRTGVTIPEQPSNFRNRQGLVRQMTFSKIRLKALHNAGERQTLRCKPPCKRSPAHTQFAGNFAGLCLAMRQKENDGILDT